MLNFLILFLTILISGCTTIAHLPAAPSVYSMFNYEGNLTVGLTKIIDERKEKHTGSVGGLPIDVPSNLGDFVAQHLMARLNKELKVNVQPIIDRNSNQNKVDLYLTCHIKQLSIFSIDSILQPVETVLVLKVEVFDLNNQLLYADNVTGVYVKRMGLIVTENAFGRVVEGSIKNALDQLLAQQGFLATLENFKS